MSAQYLVRFDDICPTMNWSVWDQVEEAMVSAGVKPILAVVPDNQDPKLKVAEPKAEFWEKVRAWQKQGWGIGLHGYQHLHASLDGGILKLNPWGEFSGLPFDEQRAKLQSGWEIFQREGVRPDLWIAPAHSFDANTLRALYGIGIRSLSDGFSLYPYRDSVGMTWVPQQLWNFRKMPFGLWTICLHLNAWSDRDIDNFGSSLRQFSGALTDWHSVVSRYQGRRLSLTDRLFSKAFPAAQRARYRRAQKRLQQSPQNSM